jgi:tetratricopeptide (TPR) repeat protein
MVAIAFPLALAGVMVWRPATERRRARVLIGVMLIASAAMSSVLIYKWVNGAIAPGASVIERLAFAGTAPWLYLWRTIVPVGLGLDLQRWSPTGWTMWLGWVGIGACVAIAIALRRQLPRGMVALGFVAAALCLPGLGWLPWMYMTQSDTAGHVAYAMVAPIVAGIAWAACRWFGSHRPGVLAPALAGLGAVMIGSAVAGSMLLAPSYRDLDRAMERQLTLNPDSPEVLLLRAGQLMGATDANFNEAEVLIRRALERDPRHRAATMAMAELFLRRRDFDRALQMARQAEQISPGIDVLLTRASIETARGRSTSAMQLLDQVLADPTLSPRRRAEVLSSYALLRHQRGELAAARQLLEQAIELSPRFSDARINLANILYQTASNTSPPDEALIRQAVHQLEQVLEFDKQNPIVWLNAGAMAASLGNYNRAEVFLREAVAYAPGNIPALQNLGSVLLQRARDETEAPIRARLYGDAVVCFRRLAELQPDNPTAAENLRTVQSMADANARGERPPAP